MKLTKKDLFKAVENLETAVVNLENEIKKHKEYADDLLRYQESCRARLIYLRKRLAQSENKIIVEV